MNAPANRKASPRSEINVTPLIDIVLVLLIVFIVMVPGMAKALSASIPTTTGEQKGDRKDDVVVSLDQNGILRLQQDEVTLDQLAEKLTATVQLQPMFYRKVFFKIDEDISHQRTVQVLDRIRVASEKAKQETVQKMGRADLDGGDVKVAMTLRKRV
jgi:biopolymer transport protein TolR